MKNLIFYFLVLCLALQSCDTTLSVNKTYIVNNSGFDAVLEFNCQNFDSERVNPIFLMVNSKNLLLSQADRGKAISRTFTSNYETCDSVVIKFSNGKKLIYVGVEIQSLQNKICKNSDCIIIDDPRSILNSSNYEKNITDETKRKLETELIFTLTREDYIKAK